MSEEISFKERVKNEIISAAKVYMQIYVYYEYLICSDAFIAKDYYIIDAKPDNYQHLTGVNSLISSQDFFNKCCDGTLQVTDFNFIKQGQSEKSVKGSVRRKIAILPYMMNLFQGDVLVEETFTRNQIICTFATADNKCTLGFIDSSKSRPMSLLKGNELNTQRAKKIRSLLRKHITREKFDEIIIGNSKTLMEYYDVIKNHISDNLISTDKLTKINKSEFNMDKTG